MDKYTVLIESKGMNYSFGISTLGGVFELLGASGVLDAFKVIEYVDGQPITVHEYRKPVLTSI